MKTKMLLINLITVMTIISVNAQQKTQNHPVKVKESKIEWNGRKHIGNNHRGTIEIKNGELTTQNGIVTGGKFIMDMNSIKDLDLTDKKDNEMLVNHLKSEDFFNVAKHPTAEVAITHAKKVDNKPEGEPNYVISGQLTIKGVTHPISFPARVKVTSNGIEAWAECRFDRSKYDVRFGSANFFAGLGDEIIDDYVALKIHLVTQ